MNTLIGIGGLIFVSAVTPGPNNLAVMQIAGERGLKAASAAIVGVVLGSLALLLLTQSGLEMLATRHAWLRTTITVVGAGYLGFLGASAVYRSFKTTKDALGAAPRHPRSALALFVFQFTNPKAWILVLTATAAARCGDCTATKVLTTLMVLLTAIPVVCLTAWALLGFALARRIQGFQQRVWLARALGMLLLASAASVLVP
jgi:threonine/homoserine/homoserine lactone efflux protein